MMEPSLQVETGTNIYFVMLSITSRSFAGHNMELVALFADKLLLTPLASQSFPSVLSHVVVKACFNGKTAAAQCTPVGVDLLVNNVDVPP